MSDSRTPVQHTSEDLVAQRREELRRVFPEACTEDGLDFDKLREALGEFVDDAPERYSFTWAGKRDGIRLLQMPSRATLTPAPEESLDWDTTANLFIEGENLEALKLLLKPYYGRVKMIYIDPPYNTGNDFIYPDDYRDPLGAYLEQTGQVAGQGDETHRNRITSGRKHSGWLSMMYPRLWLARQLLRDDGVIFVSIDDNEVHNLLLLLREVFGEENHIATFTWVKKRKGSHLSKTRRSMTEYVACFGKQAKCVNLFGEEAYADKWQPLAKRTNSPKVLHFAGGVVETTLDDGTYESGTYGQGSSAITLLEAAVVASGLVAHPFSVRGPFVWTQAKLDEELAAGTRISLSSKFGFNVFRHDQSEKFKRPTTLLNGECGVGTNEDASEELLALFGTEGLMDYPKPASLVRYFVRSCTEFEHDGLVFDFFAGSCTTAQAVLELNRESGGNRRFVMVQLPEPTGRDDFATIAEIGKERIRRVVARLRETDTGKLDLPDRETPEDLGFRVFKLAPSNYRNWPGVDAEDSDDLPDRLARQMELYADGLAEGWEPGAVIAEVALKEAGFGLGYAVETLGESLWRVTDSDTDRFFIVSLADEVRLEDLEALGLDKETLLVCRATALDDTTAGNLQLQCRLKVI